MTTRPIKLAVTAIATAVVGILFLSFANPQALYRTKRCWQAAASIFDCYGKGHVNFDFTTDFFGMRYQGNYQNAIDREVLTFGAYEKPFLFFLRDVMARVSPDGSGIFVDVGANNGHHSMFMSRYAKEVHAFEPYEPVVEKFRRMIALNRINNIKIYPVGLGDKSAELPFFKPADSNDMTGSFIDGWENNAQYKKMQIVVGDDALEKAGVRKVDLLKIDVEGYEKPVLLGLARTLNASRPIVEFELSVRPNKPLGFKSMKELNDAFPKDYKFLVFDQNCDAFTGSYTLTDLKDIDFGVEYRRDMVAYPGEKQDQIPRSGPVF